MAMQLTRAGEYAVRSLVYLATQDEDARVMASQVASAENIPVNFVRKILESLAKTGLVKSYRGAGGGFTLGRDAAGITLRQIVEAIEGPFAVNECLTPNGCDRMSVCSVSQIWMEVQHAVEDILDRYSLADIAHTARLRRQAGVVLTD
ncbi:MAG TPA: Rrf2 family transcriptional regulator [Armatimonadota bacterium]|nr:Rrf2 family transcriptional regulator [Armatimonadota bacterium]